MIEFFLSNWATKARHRNNSITKPLTHEAEQYYFTFVSAPMPPTSMLNNIYIDLITVVTFEANSAVVLISKS